MILHIGKRKLISESIIAIIIFFMVVIVCFGLNWQRNDGWVLGSFFVNGFVWIVLLLFELQRFSFSINAIQWFFCTFFFFIAPLSQYLGSNFPQGIYILDELCFAANIVLFLWTFFYIVGVIVANKKKVIVNDKFKKWKLRKNIIFILVLMAIGVCVYNVNLRGFLNLFSRGTRSTNTQLGFDFYFDMVMGAVVYFATVYSGLIKPLKIRVLALTCCLISLFIAYFPIGISRHAAAGMYFAVMLYYFRNFISGTWFMSLYSVSFVVIFPLFNLFRNVSVAEVDIQHGVSILLNDYAIYWQTINYDAYSLFALSCQYFWEKGIEWGHQLLGTVFFWIPRAWWPTKPITTGAFIAEYAGFSFTNVSSALPEEFMVDFGIVGVIIGAFVVGYFSTRFDNRYWIGKDERFAPLYFTMVSFAMIFYRGQLMSAFAFWSPYLFVWFLTTRRFYKKE